jgi:hypothetical protein
MSKAILSGVLYGLLALTMLRFTYFEKKIEEVT